MRKGWEYKKLGKIAKCAIGLTYKPENVTEELSGTIVLRSSNIQNSILDFNDIVRVNVPVKEDKIVKDGDILMCSRNGSIRLVGKVALIKNLKERMSYGAFMTIIRSQYNPYLFEYFKTPAFRQYLIAGKTTTVNQITVKMLNNLTIPLPPKSTQLAIVSELDKINELIRLKKEQLKDFDNLAQSLFFEMFGDPVENEKGWEVKKLDDVCIITSSKRIFADEYTETGIPFYRSKEVIERSKGLSISVELFISKERYNEIKEKFGVPKIGDILITAVGTIGKIWAIDTDNKFYFKDGNLVWLKDIDNQLANSCFFRRLLEYLIEEYKKTNANGAAYNALTIAKLKLMSCPLPPLSLQQLFAQRIEQIEREKSEVQKSIQDLETLLASRMQYWFE